MRYREKYSATAQSLIIIGRSALLCFHRALSHSPCHRTYNPLLHHYCILLVQSTSTGYRALLVCQPCGTPSRVVGSMICLLRIESQACYIKTQLHLADLRSFPLHDNNGLILGLCEF
jgi:hypothetical protein